MGDITLVTRRTVVELNRPQYVLELRPRAMINTGGGATAFADLTDVDLTDLQVGDVPKWDGSKFVNEPDATGGGGGGLIAPNVYVTEDINSLDPSDFAVGDWVLDASDPSLPVFNVAEVSPGVNEFVDDFDPLRPDLTTLTASIAQVAADLADFENYVNADFFNGISAALDGKQDLSAKDAAGGYAGLDGDGKINPSQLPAIAITDRFVVNSEAAMLALTAQTGDIAIRTDILETFILSGDPTVLGNWQAIVHPTSTVTSVFGRSGVVTAQNGDYNTSQVTESGNLYFTTARVLATALAGFAAAGTRTAVVSTDTILQAFGKVQKYLNDLANVAFSGSASDLGTGTLPVARIADGSLGLAKLANIATARFLGRSTAGSGVPEELTGTQATALLDAFTTTLKGLVPAPGSALGKFLRDDQTWVEVVSGAGPDKFTYFTDMYSAVADQVCQSYTSNGSTGIVAWPFAGNPAGSGFMRLSLNASASGRAAWGSANIANALYLRQGVSKFRTRGSIMTLSDGTNSYDTNLGFVNDLTATPTYGCFFRHNHAVNGGRWEAVCVAGGLPTVADTGVAAAADTMTIFEVEVNAAGTSVAFKINGTTVATITATIPGAGINLGFGDAIRRLTGSGAVNAFLADYIFVSQEFSGR